MTQDASPREPVTSGGEVVGLGGQPAKAPSGVWFAQVEPDGSLSRDPQGRPVRVRSPHRPPRRPLGG